MVDHRIKAIFLNVRHLKLNVQVHWVILDLIVVVVVADDDDDNLLAVE